VPRKRAAFSRIWDAPAAEGKMADQSSAIPFEDRQQNRADFQSLIFHIYIYFNIGERIGSIRLPRSPAITVA
jgi:hypothetical protein